MQTISAAYWKPIACKITFGDGALLVWRAVFKTVVGQINAVLGGFDSYASPLLSSEIVYDRFPKNSTGGGFTKISRHP